jgi:hypothetical protein
MGIGFVAFWLPIPVENGPDRLVKTWFTPLVVEQAHVSGLLGQFYGLSLGQ